jgi:stearoyl-CoA desaturase (delta-9 desaturase)
LNFTAAFIDFFAKLGLAYDLKTVSHKVIEDRVKRTGDGSHPNFLTDHHHHSHGDDDSPPVWGWGDADIPKENIEVTETLHRLKEEQ